MPKLGLGNKSSSGSSMITPGIITDSLVMRHNYNGNTVQPLSDGAAYFSSGSHNEIQIADSADLSPSSLTVSAWVHFGGINQPDQYARIIDTDGSSKSWHLRYTNDINRFVLRVSSDGTNQELCQTDNTYRDYNKWYHVSATYNSSTGDCKIYVDGMHDGTDNLSGAGALNDVSSVIHIGSATTDGATFWNGYICNVGVWGRVLTQAEIKSIMFKQYADLTTSEKTSLVSFWNLDTLTNDSLNHYSGISEKNLVLDEHNTYSSNLLSSSEQTGDSNWTTLYGDSATVITGPTTENYKSSPSSIKWVPATTDDGVRSSSFTTTAGQIYEISFWAYTTNSGNSSIRAKIEKGTGGPAASDDDDGSASTDINFTVPSANQWHQYIAYVTQETSGSASKVIITSGGQTSGDYYIDDISIREVTNAGRLV